MKKDFLKEIKYLGFTARIKRLSDKLVYSARAHYQAIDIGIQPNWHLIFLILKKERQLTVTEIAERLQFSHPAIIKIVKKMKEKGFIESLTDTNDTRKQHIQLSKKALGQLHKFEAEWENIETVLRQIVDDQFLKNLHSLEEKLNGQSFNERYKEQITSK